jgi:hypothetical protein
MIISMHDSEIDVQAGVVVIINPIVGFQLLVGVRIS